MYITNISEAKANLSRLLQEVQQGKEVIIGKAGKPIAILSAYSANTSSRKLGGSWEGRVHMSDDFDQPIDTITDSFYNSLITPDATKKRP